MSRAPNTPPHAGRPSVSAALQQKMGSPLLIEEQQVTTGVAFSADTPILTYLVFGVGILVAFSFLLLINTMTFREFLKMQGQTHIWGGLLGTAAFMACLRLGLDPALAMTASYLIFTLPMIYFWCFPRAQMLGDRDAAKAKGGKKGTKKKNYNDTRRATREYYNSVVAGFIEHLLYFLIFLGRQSGAQYSDMRRALEQEFTVLLTAWVLPVLPNISVDAMLNSYVGRQSSAIEFVADLCRRPPGFGDEFQMYQFFEGINHFLVCIGGLVILWRGRGRDVVAEARANWNMGSWSVLTAVVVFYEYGILCELLLYGPQYFWMLTLNLYKAAVDSPYAFDSEEYLALVLISSAIVFVHHTGYWIDTWSTMEVLRAWGLEKFTNCDADDFHSTTYYYRSSWKISDWSMYRDIAPVMSEEPSAPPPGTTPETASYFGNGPEVSVKMPFPRRSFDDEDDFASSGRVPPKEKSVAKMKKALGGAMKKRKASRTASVKGGVNEKVGGAAATSSNKTKIIMKKMKTT
mmetsp:Transcript_11921/g.28881  ORF Transcript_11921/g.28881 Transcript_11921/m.28881 type:complete len:518 (+) Transcript_11921:42-1595(+)